MTHIYLNISFPFTDLNKQTLSFNILQFLKYQSNVYTDNLLLGIIYINKEDILNSFRLELYRHNIFKTVCRIYRYEELIDEITFNKVYNDTQDLQFKQKLNKLIKLIEDKVR